MPLVPGLYKIEFSTEVGTGFGIVVMERGKVRGGDAAFAYVGSYAEDGDRISVDVATSRHTSVPHIDSIFGADEVKAHLKGELSGLIVHLQGHAEEAPDITFKAILTHIAD